MEGVLQEINRKFISLPKEDVDRNNVVLHEVLMTFINKMREKDPLFNSMFRRFFYGGSYYDGLKVGRPEEFDLDLLLTIPKLAEPELKTSNIPGFVHLHLNKFETFLKLPEARTGTYKNFAKLVDDRHYLSTYKALGWMEGVVQKTLNEFHFHGGSRLLPTSLGNFEISLRKSGPAMTLNISGLGVHMDVDLVTCFVFSGDKWPKNGFRDNPIGSKPEFFIVPKRPKSLENQPLHRYWRLSFQEQERVLLEGKDRLKPTIKLLKKLRDTLHHDFMASYFIKTVALYLIEHKNDYFWKKSLSEVFYTVLQEYHEFLKNKKIPYFWNKNYNLIGNINQFTLENAFNRIGNIIKSIENGKNKPEVVARILLTQEEYDDLIKEEEERNGSSCVII